MDTAIAGPSRLHSNGLESPADPGSPSTAAAGGGVKRQNPLTDLIATEEIYVDCMAKIIRKVASAWSKHNFPPKSLDRVFRAIESCFRANKALLAQLNEIGPAPSSPKALGDLLMRWVSLSSVGPKGFVDLRCAPTGGRDRTVLRCLCDGVPLRFRHV
jgi:hypothetical protein